MIYLMGSLKTRDVPTLAKQLRKVGLDVFDAWHASGPEADMKWREYEQDRGHDMQDALELPFARHVLCFDKCWLNSCNVGVLVMPAGKSAHIELGYMAGQGKRTIVYFPEGGLPVTDWNLMYGLASRVVVGLDELLEALL